MHIVFVTVQYYSPATDRVSVCSHSAHDGIVASVEFATKVAPRFSMRPRQCADFCNGSCVYFAVRDPTTAQLNSKSWTDRICGIRIYLHSYNQEQKQSSDFTCDCSDCVVPCSFCSTSILHCILILCRTRRESWHEAARRLSTQWMEHNENQTCQNTDLAHILDFF